MKLKDYFIAQKAQKINENDKFFLYEKIISQKNKKTFYGIKISSFLSVKSFAYWFIMIILLTWIYWVYFFNGDFSYEWFMVQNHTNQVNADYIAKIIDFSGDFYVKHDGKYYKTNKISNWDNVILRKWSEIIFDINSWTKAKIIWPAKFSLQEKNNDYQLFISDWDFIQMESLEENINSMEIVLNDISISSEKNINLLITKKDNEYKINNQWDKLFVTKNNNNKQVDKKQMLAIKDNDITLIKDISDFWEAIAKQDLSQTFAIKNEKTEEMWNIKEMLIKEIKTENNDITEKDIWLASELGLVDQKQIPTQEQSKELYSALNNNYLILNLEWMFKNQLLWDQKEYNYYKWLLESTIQKSAKIFNLKTSKDWIVSNIETIKEQLENNHYIPSKYTENLTTIINRINHIQSIENWSNTNKEEVDQLWLKIETNTPKNLVLK